MTVSAVADLFGALSGTALNVAAPGLLANDTDSTGASLSVSAYTQPAHGTLTVNTNGSFVYTPTAGYTGADSFSYTASDAAGGSSSATASLTVSSNSNEASVATGSDLSGVSSSQVSQLNTLVGGLTGVSLALTVTNWNGLALTQLNGAQLTTALQAVLGVSTPSAALTTPVTLSELETAAAAVAQAGGSTAAASALQVLSTDSTSLTNTFLLGNLLHISTTDASLANTSLNALDLVTGASQLYNYTNITTAPTAVSISGSTLGLSTTIGSVGVSAMVVSAPSITTGPAGTVFQSGAVRLRLDLNLLNVSLNLSGLATTLAGLLGGGVTASVSASLSQLSVFVDMAAGQGTISSINALTNAVSLQGTPGLANVYLGNIANSLFFNRTHTLNAATDLGYGTVGSLAITTKLLGTTILNVSTGIEIDGSAAGATPTATSASFTSTFPESQSITQGASFITNLTTALVSSLSVQVTGSLGAILDPLVNGTILPVVTTAVASTVPALLTSTLGSVADPALQLLGSGLGDLTMTVNDLGVSGIPIANPDFATTEKNSPVVVPVLANDAAPSGDTVSVTGTTQPLHGSVVINQDGTITYTPTAGFTGIDLFTYTETDSRGISSISTVTVTVLAPPVAVNDAYTTTAGTALQVSGPGVLANDTDPNGFPLTAALVSGPSHGTLSLGSDGSFTYAPTAGYTGTDSFTYRDSDGKSVSGIATVTLTINAAPQPPVAVNDSYTATSGTLLSIAAPGVLNNDTDPRGLSLLAVLVTGPSHGTLSLSSTGSFTYAPTAGYTGTDSFTYQANDGSLLSNVATVTLTVNAAPLPPVGVADSYTTTSGTALSIAAPGVLANDTDPNGLSLTAVLATNPSHGTLSLNANGSFVYAPSAGYTGTDSFTYRDSDGVNVSAPVTVTLTVNPAVQPPVAVASSYTVTSGTALSISGPGVLANDTDPNGLSLTAVLVAGPSHGALSLNSNGSFTYIPTAGFTGTDSFTYEASDGLASSNVAQVTLTVQSAPPQANNISYVMTENFALTEVAPGVLSVDVSPSGLPLTTALVAGPSHGALTFGSDGSFTYIPTAGFVGTDSFTYEASDGIHSSNVATVTLTVNAATSPPQGNPVSYSTVTGVTLNVAAPGVLSADTDPNGLSLTAVLASSPSHGTLALNANGSFTYAPSPGFTGTDSFMYRASDGLGLSAPVVVTLTVNAAASAPTVNPSSYATTAGTALGIAAPGVLSNDTDPNGLSLTAILATGPSNGTLALNSNGSFVYVPAAGFVGQDSFTYEASNGTTASTPVTVTLTVNPAAQPPVAVNSSYSVNSGMALGITAPGVLGNDTDPSGLTMTAVLVSGPSHGTLALNANGSFVYAPAAGYSGSDSFTYRAIDSASLSSVATVNLTVNSPVAPPQGNPVSYSTVTGNALTVAAPGILGVDTDPGGLTLTAVLVSGPSHGTLSMNSKAHVYRACRSRIFGSTIAL